MSKRLFCATPLEYGPHHRVFKTRGAEMTASEQDWTKPVGDGDPAGGLLQRGARPVRARLPEDARLPRILHHREGEGGPRGRGPRVREDHRGDHRSQSGGLGAAEVALPALESLRRRFRLALPVHGHLRHRLRQVHRGRGAAVQRDRHHDHLHPTRRVPGGLEGEPGRVHQIRSGSPACRASWSTASIRT